MQELGTGTGGAGRGQRDGGAARRWASPGWHVANRTTPADRPLMQTTPFCAGDLPNAMLDANMDDETAMAEMNKAGTALFPLRHPPLLVF